MRHRLLKKPRRKRNVKLSKTFRQLALANGLAGEIGGGAGAGLAAGRGPRALLGFDNRFPLGSSRVASIEPARRRCSDRAAPSGARDRTERGNARSFTLEVRLAANPNVESEEQKRPEQDGCDRRQDLPHRRHRFEVVVDRRDHETDHYPDDGQESYPVPGHAVSLPIAPVEKRGRNVMPRAM
jgi:hypothetical protein